MRNLFKKKYSYLFFTLFVFYSFSNFARAQNLPLELVGKSNFSVLFWDIYKVNLYAEKGKYSHGQVPLTLELTYQREISSQDLVDETEKQWQRFDLKESEKKHWLTQLRLIWPDVKKNDSITFHIDHKNDTSFYFNNDFIGKIEGEAFSQALAMIWLDANGPYPEMTKQLTGKVKTK